MYMYIYRQCIVLIHPDYLSMSPGVGKGTEYVHMCHGLCMEGRGKAEGIGFLLSRGFEGLNSGFPLSFSSDIVASVIYLIQLGKGT